MAASAYATATDLGLYLPDVSSSANTSIWNVLLSMASRFIDMKCGQYFYADGFSTKYFDGGYSQIDTGQHPFYGKAGSIASCVQGATSLVYTRTYGPAPAIGDVFNLDIAGLNEAVTVSAVTGTGPYTLTVGATANAHLAGTLASTIAVKLGYFENQPLPQWIGPLAGDGYTPGTNYFLWPRNRPSAGSTADPTALRPWFGVDIATIPVSGTTYLPSAIQGFETVALAANWGWPAVPDLIKDLTIKLAARAWHARDSGWTGASGSADTGVVFIRHFDPIDEMTLLASDFVNTHL